MGIIFELVPLFLIVFALGLGTGAFFWKRTKLSVKKLRVDVHTKDWKNRRVDLKEGDSIKFVGGKDIVLKVVHPYWLDISATDAVAEMPDPNRIVEV